jgi:hypothetical protein
LDGLLLELNSLAKTGKKNKNKTKKGCCGKKLNFGKPPLSEHLAIFCCFKCKIQANATSNHGQLLKLCTLAIYRFLHALHPSKVLPFDAHFE